MNRCVYLLAVIAVCSSAFVQAVVITELDENDNNLQAVVITDVDDPDPYEPIQAGASAEEKVAEVRQLFREDPKGFKSMSMQEKLDHVARMLASETVMLEWVHLLDAGLTFGSELFIAQWAELNRVPNLVSYIIPPCAHGSILHQAVLQKWKDEGYCHVRALNKPVMCKIHGLTEAPEYNGRRCQVWQWVVNYPLRKTRRFKVFVELEPGVSAWKMIKPENLIPL